MRRRKAKQRLKKKMKNCVKLVMLPKVQEAVARQALYDSQMRKELLAKALVGERKTSERWGSTCAFLLVCAWFLLETACWKVQSTFWGRQVFSNSGAGRVRGAFRRPRPAIED